MARKPYTAKLPNNWYRSNSFYSCYMLRELTSVPVALAALNLFWGLGALAVSLDAWQTWIHFQQSPCVVVINIIAIIAALYNSYSWFQAMPKAIRIQRGTKFVSDQILILSNWVVFVIIFLALLFIAILFA